MATVLLRQINAPTKDHVLKWRLLSLTCRKQEWQFLLTQKTAFENHQTSQVARCKLPKVCFDLRITEACVCVYKRPAGKHTTMYLSCFGLMPLCKLALQPLICCRAQRDLHEQVLTAQIVEVEHSLNRFLLPVVEDRLRVRTEDLSMFDHVSRDCCRYNAVLIVKSAALMCCSCCSWLHRDCALCVLSERGANCQCAPSRR